MQRTWRSPGGNLDDLFSSKNIKVYPGFGIRFIHKKIYNAVFRIDYGYGITKMLTMELYLELPIFLRGLLNIFLIIQHAFHRMS
jgi:hypothetical protein